MSSQIAFKAMSSENIVISERRSAGKLRKQRPNDTSGCTDFGFGAGGYVNRM